MAFMEWSDAMATGIATIDVQHRWLLDLANRLHDDLTKGTATHEELGQILHGLMDYTVNHFITEEDLFNRYGYPQEAEHIKSHNAFTARTLDLLQRHEAGEAVGMAALEFVKGWLIGHILGEDKAYVAFLMEKGVR